MWIVLFTVIILAAICLCAAAIWLGSSGKDPSDQPENVHSIRGQLARETQYLNRTSRIEPNGFGTGTVMPPVPIRRVKLFPDIDLLLRRMAVLNIEPEEVDSLDPLLFRELQGRCTLCRSRGACAYDFAHNTCSRGWKEYCPNAPMLSLLSSTHQVAFSASSGARLHS
jgi:hypothetical protein